MGFGFLEAIVYLVFQFSVLKIFNILVVKKVQTRDPGI